MMIRPHSIRQLAGWLALMPLLLMAVSLESFFLHAQFAEMDRDLLEHGQLISRQLAASSEYGVFSNNREFLVSVAKSALQEDDVRAVLISNAAAEVIVRAGEIKPQDDSLIRSVNREIPMLDDGAELLIYQPVLATQIALEEAEVGRAPQQLGAVIMVMSWQRTHTLKSRLFWVTFTVTAAFFLITLFLVFLANRPIVESIRALSRAVAAVGSGNLNTRVTESSRVSELAALGSGINQMVTELQHDRAILQAAHEQLNQLNRDLEQTVRERTRQLSASLDQVQQQKLALQESESRFRRAIEAAPIPIMLHAADGKVLTVNRALTEITGYRLQDIPTIADWAEKAHGDISGMAQQEVREMFQNGVSGAEYHIRCQDGNERLWEISSVKLGQIPDGQLIAISIAVDITERKQREQLRIEKERALRDTLVREVHHRIKNNLQGVAGLLQRELGKFLVLDPNLNSAIAQVNAIAIVHGLQGAGSSETVQLGESIQNICNAVAHLAQHPLQFQCLVNSPVEIGRDEAVPVALVLNELILNAVKHSPEGSPASTVSLSTDGNRVQIVIRNLAAGKPDFNINT
ncbi:MAG: PAS domain S-box protein, partial [Proteobacteria bacterium]|nr:PAS domain S-box protein [Pseudomonadota bacterium]